MRRRASKALQEQMQRTRIEQSWLIRAVIWAGSGEIKFVLVIAAIFALYQTLDIVFSRGSGGGLQALFFVTAFLIVGVFLGVIVVTDGSKEYRETGARIRTTCGVIGAAALGVMGGATYEWIAVLAIVGAVLGYFGMGWAKYI